MIEHRLRPHKVHEPVKGLGGKALEEGVLFPGGTHPVHDVAPGLELGHHGVHRVDVVLKVRVHGDGHITAVLGGHEPRQEGVLMPPVPGQVRPGEEGALPMEPGDNLPGFVFGAVVDKEHPAVR